MTCCNLASEVGKECVMKSPYKVDKPRVKKRVKMLAVSENTLEVVNRETGEVVKASPYVGKRSLEDVGEFIKLYEPKRLLELSYCELCVFVYGLGCLDFDGKFEFSFDACHEVTGLSKKSVYIGQRGLIEKDFIRRESRGRYWVNPNIAFRGSRRELLDNISRPYYEEGVSDIEERMRHFFDEGRNS